MPADIIRDGFGKFLIRERVLCEVLEKLILELRGAYGFVFKVFSNSHFNLILIVDDSIKTDPNGAAGRIRAHKKFITDT